MLALQSRSAMMRSAWVLAIVTSFVLPGCDSNPGGPSVTNSTQSSTSSAPTSPAPTQAGNTSKTKTGKKKTPPRTTGAIGSG